MHCTVLRDIDAAAYQRHPLHDEGNIWVEKNCYIDLWIETLHACGLEPLAALGFTVAVDFEGDQWTFFKPPHSELRDLFGIDVQELNVWRPLIEHAQEHLAGGKLISTEADAFWLPDTVGTDYRRQHTKTTIVLNEIDVDRRRLGYFHNAGYYVLEGEDFARTFRLDAAPDPAFMPLFAELVRLDRLKRRPAAELASRCEELLRRHWNFKPASNPVPRFQERFALDLSSLRAHGLAQYHAWAFGTIRQLGAAFELAARHLQWLDGQRTSRYQEAASAFENIATSAKSLILKAARAVNSGRDLDTSALFNSMSTGWQQGMDLLGERLA